LRFFIEPQEPDTFIAKRVADVDLKIVLLKAESDAFSSVVASLRG